ncbi:MAG: patatin-like phospholipase family protein [Bdellovibrio sp.]|nr:patatin-like phospholipase family protein [Bdellovibrio sp.]
MQKRRADALAEKPFSLSLSSGFFGFFAHAGFVQALEEMQLKPEVVTGSSAGAIVSAGLGSGLSAKEIRNICLGLKKSDFWDPGLGFGLLKGEKLEQFLGGHLLKDFSEMKLPVQISVFDILARKTKVLTSGSVAKACRASCAVPLLFQPVRIDGRLYWDGGVLDRPAIKGLEESPYPIVYHYLDAKGWVSNLEDRRIYKKHHEAPFFLKTLKIPAAGPNKLHVGPEVIDYAYKESLKWLSGKV